MAITEPTIEQAAGMAIKAFDSALRIAIERELRTICDAEIETIIKSTASVLAYRLHTQIKQQNNDYLGRAEFELKVDGVALAISEIVKEKTAAV